MLAINDSDLELNKEGSAVSSDLAVKKALINHPHLWGVVVMCILLLGAFSSWYYWWAISPVNQELKLNHQIEIMHGFSSRQIGNLLERKGLIRSELVFQVYLRLNLAGRSLKSGQYHLDTTMGVGEIVERLTRGSYQDIKVTIPEGLTVTQIAQLLAKKGIVKEERFLAVAKDRQFIRKELGPEFAFFDSLEGYLFPDTYSFSVKAKEEEIIKIMLARFTEIFIKNFASIPQKEWPQLITIASLVEKEAKRAAEREIIAGVFYNRLRKKILLQSCATVQYALGEHKKRLTYQDLKVDSPYNTYTNQGLPPGPIANPGLASLKAAAFPAQVKYLYFFAKPDGSHVFSKTYRQHLNAQRRVK